MFLPSSPRKLLRGRYQVERYEKRHEIGSTPRLALALLLYTGQRRSDIVLFGRQHVRGGWLRFTQQKLSRSTKVASMV
jgi:integrase